VLALSIGIKVGSHVSSFGLKQSALSEQAAAGLCYLTFAKINFLSLGSEKLVLATTKVSTSCVN